MQLACFCGQNINLSKKEIQKILIDEELFCCPNCLHSYIKSQVKVKQKLDYPSKNVYISCPTEIYDRVTKRQYRSLYEAYFARFCQKNKIEFWYEPFYYQVESKFYTPDFYLPDYNLSVEVKGLWQNSAKKKYLAIRQQINIILLPAYLQKEFKKEFGLKTETIK